VKDCQSLEQENAGVAIWHLFAISGTPCYPDRTFIREGNPLYPARNNIQQGRFELYPAKMLIVIYEIWSNSGGIEIRFM